MNHEQSETRLLNIALAGNPNVGKSTIFNNLTGMRQHTGNWAGKTVSNARGRWEVKRNDGSLQKIELVDVPGCYSLEAGSPEEELARDYICCKDCDGIIVVCDGTCLERNLILVLQIMQHTPNVIVCVNLMDQVRKKHISIDLKELEEILGIPVTATEAKKKREMRKALERYFDEGWPYEGNKIKECYNCREFEEPENLVKTAEKIASQVVKCSDAKEDLTMRVDRVLTNPVAGFPAVALLMTLIFWITIKGANYPSQILGDFLFSLEKPLYDMTIGLGMDSQICNMLTSGIYRVLAWVVSVMLPPMAIFFPLFTLLEDWGFLPRIAFNLDRCFKCCKACGKQALTMCMGLGCNASAVVGCRIINSERERLLAIVTNSLMPCNGRFPMLLAIITMFFAAKSSWQGAGILGAVILLGVAATLALTKLLSATILKGVPSSFTLELPPYRKPEIGKVIVRSVFDRTLFVLGRAVAVAAPTGAVIWILANVPVGNTTVILAVSELLDPFGKAIGLDGVIIMAFILGLPANEIVLPIIMMTYMSNGTLTQIDDLSFFRELLIRNGWTILTALNMLIFGLMHWPCATTLLSAKKETGGWKWPVISIAAPFMMGTFLCAATTFLYRIIIL